MVSVYLLLLANEAVADPAALVSEVSDWRSGDTFAASGGQRFRILATHEAEGPARLVFDGIWTVEPVRATPWGCAREPKPRKSGESALCSRGRASRPSHAPSRVRT